MTWKNRPGQTDVVIEMIGERTTLSMGSPSVQRYNIRDRIKLNVKSDLNMHVFAGINRRVNC